MSPIQILRFKPHICTPISEKKKIVGTQTILATIKILQDSKRFNPFYLKKMSGSILGKTISIKRASSASATISRTSLFNITTQH